MYFLYSNMKLQKELNSIIKMIKENIEITHSLDENIDGIITLGGDGTILRVLRCIKNKSSPLVFSFNYGHFGCLCGFKKDDIYKIKEILESGSSLDYIERKRLKIKDYGYFLNDLNVTKDVSGRLNKFVINVDGYDIGPIRADSIIVSTPTGSTAYNLSAGGPFVHNNCDVIIITAVCPSKTNLKPMVFPLTSVVKITMEKNEFNDGVPMGFIDGCDEIVGVNEFTVFYDGSTIRFPILGSKEVYENDSLKNNFYW